ncbi:energy-coupling factor ABC transporter ATP-binding protein [Hutsoniella sourekii]
MSEIIVKGENIKFQYPQTSVHVLNGVDFEIYRGEWVAIIGPNGSGKSTLAKVINGLLVPESGRIEVKGLTLSEDTIWDVRRAVGMVFQNPDNQFVGATVEDDVAFGLENNGIEREEMIRRVHEALEEVNMTSFKKREPAHLSGGQKQRVALASIIALRPNVIILDEATAMLDPLGRLEVIEAIQRIKERYNLTVLSITHDLNEASLADRVLVMNQGRVLQQAKPEEIFQMGEELISIGLDVPFAKRLQDALSDRGITVPEEFMDREELIQWITTSYLTK